MQTTDETIKGELAARWLSAQHVKEVAKEMGMSRGAVACAATHMGLPPTRRLQSQRTDAGLRACMCCGGQFYSAWKGNRLCIRRNGEA